MKLSKSFQSALKFCAWILMVSLVIESANVVVHGSIEASSPEDRHENDSPLSSAIPSQGALTNSAPLIDFADESLVGSGAVSPILTEGVFPYQPNPLAAVVAAGLTMAMMTLKETGKIDLEGLGYLLNSTDFYVGVIGSGVASITQRKLSRMIAATLKNGIAKGPEVLKPILTSNGAKQIGAIVDGFTYTFAITSFFEYFSQIWKHATKNVPEAHTVSGFIKADKLRKKQVALNLMYYLVVDTNMQKRILSSVYTHRILTFEFIATNVALYMGAQLGNFLALKYGPKNPWLKKIGPMLGSISGGLLIQAIPRSWTNSANSKLVDWKLSSAQKTLEDDLRQIEESVKSGFYPVDDKSKGGYFLRGASLDSDLDRVLRTRDMIASLQLQKILSDESKASPLNELQMTYRNIEDRLENLRNEVRRFEFENLPGQVSKWLQENRSGDEIQKMGERYTQKSAASRHYGLLLDAAIERSKISGKAAQGLIEIIEQKTKLDPSDAAVFGAE